MDDHATRLLQLRGIMDAAYAAARQHVDDMIADAELDLTEREREGITLASFLVRRYGPYSEEQASRWRQAIVAGEESWLLLRSVPGEHRADAWCIPTLKPHIRKALTGE